MLRIGVLGAARIAPTALIAPARSVDGVTVAAVAARDPARAQAFAAKFGVPATRSYDELVRDEQLDAIYNPLPNGLHHEWTLRALDAGKHVLCEKPFTANAAEAAEIADRAQATGLVVMEAFHYRYHPLAERMVEIAGELGEVRRVETAMWSSALLRIRARVTGVRGSMTVTNFAAPQYFHRVTMTVDGRTRRAKVAGEPTYTHQLRAFAAAVGGDSAANLTPPEDSVRTMRLIDAAYEAAGLPLRGTQ